MSKYIGTSSGLIGPVTMEKPEKKDYFISEISARQLGVPQFQEEKYLSDLSAYEQALSSLPVIPCEGWVPVKGKEHVEKVHFSIKRIPVYEGSSICEWEAYAVPPPAANDGGEVLDATQLNIGRLEVNCFDEDSEMSFRIGHSKYQSLTIEEAERLRDYLTYHINCEKSALSTVQTIPSNDGNDEFLTYVKNSRTEFTSFVSDNECKPELRTAIDSLLICFDQMADRLQKQTYPAEFVEWVSNSRWSFVPILNYWQNPIKIKQLTTAELFNHWQKTKQ